MSPKFVNIALKNFFYSLRLQSRIHRDKTSRAHSFKCDMLHNVADEAMILGLQPSQSILRLLVNFICCHFSPMHVQSYHEEIFIGNRFSLVMKIFNQLQVFLSFGWILTSISFSVLSFLSNGLNASNMS